MDKKIILHIPHLSIIFPMIAGFVADKATLDWMRPLTTDNLNHVIYDIKLRLNKELMIIYPYSL